VTLQHDGFSRATPVRVHSRQIALENEQLAVTDRFEGSGTVDLALCWHFSGDFEILDNSRSAVVGKSEEVLFSFEGVVEAPRVEPILNGSGPWISDAYGRSRPALGIAVSWNLSLPIQVTSRFRLVSRS
jgi:hypothetical protein